jgi:hypothetical protein
MDTRDSISGSKVAKYEADYSPSLTALFEKEWSFTFTPPYVFMV